MIKKKIVISDMDGTLLKSDKSISQKTIDTVNKMRKNNIEFTIATGRIYPVVIETVEEMSITKPLILCNGAIIQDPITKEIYYSKLLEDDIAKKILELADKSGSYFYYYTSDSIHAKKLKYTTKYYYDRNKNLKHEQKIKVNIDKDMLSKDIKEVYKVVILDENEDKLNKIRQDLQEYKTYVEVVSSFKNNIEIVANKVTKGEGVKFFAEKFGYDIENIMCIGDEENDESMLKVSGFPVAMGNASNNMKKIAKYITSDNDSDGMSEAIIEFSKR